MSSFGFRVAKLRKIPLTYIIGRLHLTIFIIGYTQRGWDKLGGISSLVIAQNGRIVHKRVDFVHFILPCAQKIVTLQRFFLKFQYYTLINNMALKIVVLAKQVPDTRNVGKDAMTAEGTVNRAALPAIFNPEDLNALEQALRLKEQNPGSTVGILTMGPPRAGEIIRQGLYRGADTGWLLTDRLFAGADTLATSYALATAIKKIGDVDIVIGGRQAIDGDTAQVGPQVAQKLGLNQVTYAEEVLSVKDGKATIKRVIDGGVETVEAPLPVVITVNGSAAPCRPQNAKLVMKYKRATCPMERPAEGTSYDNLYEERPYLTLNQWSVADVDGDANQCGLAGSPTKVKAVKNIVFQAKESKTLTASDADVEGMIKELLEEKIIG